jgi:hypothetical protein
MCGGNNGPGNSIPGKSEWPELVGKPATPSVSKIMHDRPDVTVVIVGEGTPVPGGYNGKRVRVFYDTEEPDAPLTRIPVIG